MEEHYHFFQRNPDELKEELARLQYELAEERLEKMDLEKKKFRNNGISTTITISIRR